LFSIFSILSSILESNAVMCSNPGSRIVGTTLESKVPLLLHNLPLEIMLRLCTSS
jgi:hypothetical protein